MRKSTRLRTELSAGDLAQTFDDDRKPEFDVLLAAMPRDADIVHHESRSRRPRNDRRPHGIVHDARIAGQGAREPRERLCRRKRRRREGPLLSGPSPARGEVRTPCPLAPLRHIRRVAPGCSRKSVAEGRPGCSREALLVLAELSRLGGFGEAGVEITVTIPPRSALHGVCGDGSGDFGPRLGAKTGGAALFTDRRYRKYPRSALQPFSAPSPTSARAISIPCAIRKPENSENQRANRLTSVRVPHASRWRAISVRYCRRRRWVCSRL